MYNKVYKNYQVNLGMPFQVKMPVNLQNVKPMNLSHNAEDETGESLSESNVGNDPVIMTEEILEKAKEEAEFIIKEAHYEAARIMDEAQNQAEQLMAAAIEEGRNSGYQDGCNEARIQYENLINEAECLQNNARVEYNQVLAGIEADAIGLILEIAKKVIGEEVVINKENVLFLVKQAFDKCSNKENVVLKVSSEDYDFIIENKERMLSMLEGVGEIDIKKDGALRAGACIVETPFGSIDASVQTRINNIEEVFKQLIKYGEGN